MQLSPNKPKAFVNHMVIYWLKFLNSHKKGVAAVPYHPFFFSNIYLLDFFIFLQHRQAQQQKTKHTVCTNSAKAHAPPHPSSPLQKDHKLCYVQFNIKPRWKYYITMLWRILYTYPYHPLLLCAPQGFKETGPNQTTNTVTECEARIHHTKHKGLHFRWPCRIAGWQVHTRSGIQNLIHKGKSNM